MIRRWVSTMQDGRYSTPTLTTVAPDKEMIARCALDLLAERMAQGSARPAREVTVGHALVRRDSTLG